MRNRILCGVMCLALAPSVQAGILGDLGTMFMSNSTAPSTLQSRDRTGVFGGSYDMRTPIKSVNVVAFDPPRMDAGCGGIDLYGGSFSFINGKQLVDIFRKVAANAAGLAFKAAIKMISPSLDALISEFQALMQNLNNLAKNSCQLSHLVVDPAEAALSRAVNGEGNIGATQKAMFSDVMDTLTNYLTSAKNVLAQAGSVTPTLGNQVAKAAVASGTSATLGLAGLGNPDGSLDDPANPNSLNNQLLYAIIGYEIDGVPCSGANDSGGTTTTQNVSSLPRVTCKGPPTVTLDQLMDGGGPGSTKPDVPLVLYKCLNPSGSSAGAGFDPQICTSMQKRNFNYVGVRGWVNQQLFGSADRSTVVSGSIVDQFNANATTSLTPAQIQFSHQAGNGLLALLGRASAPERRYAIAYRLSNVVASCIGSKLGESLYVAAVGVQNDNAYKLSEDQKASIRALREDYMRLKDVCLRDETVLKITQELNSAAVLNSKVNR